MREYKIKSVKDITPLKELMLIKLIAEKKEYVTKTGIIISTMKMSDTPDQDARLKPREHAPGMCIYQIVKLGASADPDNSQLKEGGYIIAFDMESQQTTNKLDIGDDTLEKYYLVNQFLACANLEVNLEDDVQDIVVPKEPSKIKIVQAVN